MKKTLWQKRKNEDNEAIRLWSILFAIYLAVSLFGMIINTIYIECPANYEVISEEKIIVKNIQNWDHITIQGKIIQNFRIVENVRYKTEFNGESEIEVTIEDIIRRADYSPEEVEFLIEEVTMYNFKDGAIWPIIFQIVIVAWPIILILLFLIVIWIYARFFC